MNLSMDSSTVCIFDLQEQDKYTVMNAGETDMNVFASSFFSDSSSTNPREMTSFDLFKYIKQITEEGTASTLQMNIHKKFSLPFASIFFAMLAMPLAIIFGKHNGMAVGLIIGIFLCVAYWAAMIMGQTFGIRQGLDGFWTMWLPDFLVGVAGLLFYLRLAKK